MIFQILFRFAVIEHLFFVVNSYHLQIRYLDDLLLDQRQHVLNIFDGGMEQKYPVLRYRRKKGKLQEQQ